MHPSSMLVSDSARSRRAGITPLQDGRQPCQNTGPGRPLSTTAITTPFPTNSPPLFRGSKTSKPPSTTQGRTFLDRQLFGQKQCGAEPGPGRGRLGHLGKAGHRTSFGRRCPLRGWGAAQRSTLTSTSLGSPEPRCSNFSATQPRPRDSNCLDELLGAAWGPCKDVPVSH